VPPALYTFVSMNSSPQHCEVVNRLEPLIH